MVLIRPVSPRSSLSLAICGLMKIGCPSELPDVETLLCFAKLPLPLGFFKATTTSFLAGAMVPSVLVLPVGLQCAAVVLAEVAMVPVSLPLSSPRASIGTASFSSFLIHVGIKLLVSSSDISELVYSSSASLLEWE